MERQGYTLKKEKKGCVGNAVGIGLLLFFVLGIIASIANMIYDFGATSVIAGIVMIAICGGLGYVVGKSFFSTKIQTIFLDEDGIEYKGMPMMADKKYDWAETKVVMGNTPGNNIPFINISFPSGLPLIVHENRLDDFDGFVENVQHFHTLAIKREADTIIDTLREQSSPRRAAENARTLSHQRALAWWEETGKEEAICDGCNRDLSKGSGFLVGSYLYCYECVKDKF